MGAASSGDRIDAAWLRDPALVAIFDAMAAGGHEVRVVGGAVRDTLLRPDGPASPPDVDLATTATPDETITAAEAAGLKPVPTGVDHGTVTIIAAGTPFEVTTLRRDVETDGRHAVVSFTTDWAEDAARRDFTINALFCDATGQVFDPVGDGRQDLAARRLRFIGDPEARIREDYLRTVRLFRFLAELEGFQADRGAFHATTNAREGLRTLSGERLQREFAKLFVALHAAHAIRQMQRFGVFAELLPFAPAPGLLDELHQGESSTRSWLTAFAAVFLEHAKDVRVAADRLRLSNRDRDALIAMLQARDLVRASSDRHFGAQHAAVAFGRDAALSGLALAFAGGNARADHHRITAAIAAWPIPEFPVSGADLIAAGATPGPDLGRRLAALRRAWVESAFSLTRDALLAEAKTQIGPSRAKENPA